jgi:hypothetical protein
VGVPCTPAGSAPAYPRKLGEPSRRSAHGRDQSDDVNCGSRERGVWAGRCTLPADRTRHVMSTNRTHRTRLARALAAVSDIPYQTALTRVVRAADAGLLPDLLDAAGMRHALNLLIGSSDEAPTAAGTTAPGSALEPRYYQLAQICGDRLQPGVQKRIARARALGMPAMRTRGSVDPVEMLGDVMANQDDPDTYTGWWQRVATAGRRQDCALPDPYPPGSSPDGYVPIDRALDERDATGDVEAYERTLHAIIRREPRDIDAHTHLGHLYQDMADPDSSKITVTPPPDNRQQQAWLRTALGHYQTAVAVAELALPEPFTGVLAWAELDNRPFFRALHGMAVAMWRLHHFGAAENVLLNMLWLNPADNQGARTLLTSVRERRAWEATDEP